MSGKVADGLALLDEAMVTVLEGRLDPFMTGVLYCHTIAACREVGDVRRMTRWTDLAEEWLTTVPAEAVFGAMCAVHRVQLRLLRGEWDRAELEAQRLTARLDANRVDYAAHAWYVVGEARRLRGQPGAAEAYAEAHARGLDPQPGRALLQLTDGDPEGALVSVRSAVAAARTDPLRRAPLLAAMVEIAIAAAQAAGRGGCRFRARADGIHLSHLRPGGDGGDRARRCVSGRRRPSRKPCRCSATPVDAGTNLDRTTRPPGPASDSPRHTGRSATPQPQPRSWRGPRQSSSGWVRATE